ncbi:MAG: phosphate--acyl-ACP acyltransferase, partial [Eubacteriales bacterium]
MRIIIDAMGGDNAPSEIVKGAIRARAEQKVDLTLVGDRRQIYSAAAHEDLSLSGIDIIHTETVVLPDDNPISVMKNKSDASMSIGLKMLMPDNEYGVLGDAFLSAGSTGALHACSTLIVHKLPGVRRSGIA